MVTAAAAPDSGHGGIVPTGAAARVLVCRLGRVGGEVAHSGSVRHAGVFVAATPSVPDVVCISLWSAMVEDLVGGGLIPSESSARPCRCR